MLLIRNNHNIDNVTFDKKNCKKNISKRGYSENERVLRHEINTAAMRLGWIDVYTGKKFTKTNPSSIEHIISFYLRKTSKGFNINRLGNIFPAGVTGNNLRGDEPFAETVLLEPKILDRLLIELSKYAKYKSPLIDGKGWAKELLTTVLEELQGLHSDIATRKISM